MGVIWIPDILLAKFWHDNGRENGYDNGRENGQDNERNSTLGTSSIYL